MKTSIKKFKNCKKVVDVSLPPEKVRDEFDRVYAGIQRMANIPGFRTGKAPRDLIEKHYAKTAEEEVIKNLIPETYRDILEQHKLDPIGHPDITDVKLDMKEGLSYKASLETRPEVNLKNYKGLRLKKKSVEIKEEDVQKNLESLREAAAQNVPKKDSEEKEKVLPALDNDFAKDLGFEGLDKLKGAIRDNLKKSAEQDARVDMEMQAINQLIETADFDIPDSIVRAEKARLVKDANTRLAYMQAIQNKQDPDKKLEMTDKDRKELEENAERQASRQVKAFFILDKIAQLEKIYLKEEEIEKRIEEMAGQYKKSKEEVRLYLEKNNLLDEMAVNMRNAKVMEFLVKEAKLSN